MTASVFGPVVNALVAAALFAVMLVIVRSRRPSLRRGEPARTASGVAPATGRETERPVCSDPATGR